MSDHQSFRSEPLEALASQIADPRHHSGGGAVAAISASLASALAVMIGSLSKQRRSNEASREEISGIVDELRALIEEFHISADADSEVLVELMAAYRARADDETGYVQTLDRAAKSTLKLGEDIRRLLLLTERLVPFATRFTVSDIGGAAAIAQGALTAALLTVDVNIRMLRDKLGDTADVAEMAHRLAELESNGRAISERVEAQTRSALAGESR